MEWIVRVSLRGVLDLAGGPGRLTSDKTVTRFLAMSQPTVTQSTFLLSFGFGCHGHHSGVLKPALGGNREYFHSQTLGDSDRLEPRGTLNFI